MDNTLKMKGIKAHPLQKIPCKMVQTKTENISGSSRKAFADLDSYGIDFKDERECTYKGSGSSQGPMKMKS